MIYFQPVSSRKTFGLIEATEAVEAMEANEVENVVEVKKIPHCMNPK